MKLNCFQDLVGKKFQFGGLVGTVAEYDSWDSYLCTFNGKHSAFFHLEDLLEMLIDEDKDKTKEEYKNHGIRVEIVPKKPKARKIEVTKFEA